MEFENLLHENLQIEVRGYSIRKLMLHRHFPRHGEVSAHHHPDHDQILVYLRGRGLQIRSGEVIPITRGSFVWMPRGIEHGFRREKAQAPLCLAIDLCCTDPSSWQKHGLLASDLLNRIEGNLRQLHHQNATGLETATWILEIVSWLEQANRASSNTSGSGVWSRRVRSYLSKTDLRWISPTRIAEELNQKPATLNRFLQREGEVTLNKLLTALRLDEARRLLKNSDLQVGEIGARVGILDQNYFARWFRKQTGQSPTHWRQGIQSPNP
ncbi:MAG: helix-turn-helix domain-containing protein [Verrucomicrobiota bacterium]